MSPASQGGLEVERYIGSNLISSCARVNNFRNNGKGRKPEGKVVLQRSNVNQVPAEGYQHHGSGGGGGGGGGTGGNRQCYLVPNMMTPCGCRGALNGTPRAGQFSSAAGWTGMPLISVAGDGKKKNKQQQQQQYQDRSRKTTTEDDSSLRTPLSRLAIHTQGAPLILSGRCYNGRKNQNRGNQVRGPRGDIVIRRSNKYKDGHSHGHGGTSDCLSVASDESSGSGHSENCLPRIIKPRKRRKKDRKPSIPSRDNYGPNEETGANGLERPKNGSEEGAEAEVTTTTTTTVAVTKTPQKCDTKPNPTVSTSKPSNGSQVSDEGSEEDESHGPKLHHRFEDVTESESASYGCLPSSCQCHYCDPSGIWDAPPDLFPGRGGIPFLTPPPDTNKSFHYSSHSDLVLRRSWSEPMPGNESQRSGKGTVVVQPPNGLPFRSNSFSEVKTLKSKDWWGWSSSPFGEDNRWEWIKDRDSDKSRQADAVNGDVCKKESRQEKVNLSYGSQCLEVSTEIVTSPDGHRDIEIRFYSTSPSS